MKEIEIKQDVPAGFMMPASGYYYDNRGLLTWQDEAELLLAKRMRLIERHHGLVEWRLLCAGRPSSVVFAQKVKDQKFTDPGKSNDVRQYLRRIIGISIHSTKVGKLAAPSLDRMDEWSPTYAEGKLIETVVASWTRLLAKRVC